MAATDDDLRHVWEAKELVLSTEHINARRDRAARRLLQQDPGSTLSPKAIEEGRFAIEEEMFQAWLQAKRFSGFDGV